MKDSLTESALKERGWTDSLIRELQPKVCKRRKNRRSASATSITLYDLRDVEMAERSPKFAAAVVGRIRRKLDRYVTFGGRREEFTKAHAFIDTWRWLWRKVPLGDRRKMIKYWRNMRPNYSDLPLYIEIVDGRVNEDGDAHAATMWQGCALYFHRPTIDKMDEGVVPVLMAHELAHCLQFAEGWKYESSDEREQAAMKIAAGWGFHEEMLDRWESLCAQFSAKRSVSSDINEG